MKIRTRFAPSPTGNLHIGGIRTALYCYALAHKHNGQFILRIEDTDQTRLVEGSQKQILAMLKEYGIEPDESIEHGGNFGPYVQSQRLELYKRYADQLVEQGDAYYCFSTKEEIESQKESAEKTGERFQFTSPFRDLPIETARKRIEEGESYVVRQKIPKDEKISFEDPLQGKMEFNSNDINDGVLLKADGYPTYHLAVVVDDHLMNITHVFRGVEWISSVPKHVLLYKAFGWEMPKIFHLALILDPNGGKLSKRNGSVSADEFLAEGYLPEAILNFLMLLGWSSPEERVHGEKEKEFYSLQDFVELFDTNDLNKPSPIFNREKLIWFNQKYIQQLSPDKLVLKYTKWLDEHTTDHNLKKLIVDNGPDFLQDILELVRERIKLLSDISEMIMPFYKRYDKNLIINTLSTTKQTKKLDKTQIEEILNKFRSKLLDQESIKSWGHENWESDIRNIAEESNLKAGEVFMTLRIAVLGSPFSPPLFESIEVLEKEEVLSRLE